MNKDTQSFGQTIVKADASTAYIAIDFVKQYSDFQYNYYTDPNRVVLTNAWGDYTIASAKQKTEIRYQGGIKSPILTEADKNTELTILGLTGCCSIMTRIKICRAMWRSLINS